MGLRRSTRALTALLAALAPACASHKLAVGERAVQEESESIEWRAAAAGDLVGQWRARSIKGPAAAVLMDLAYWIAADGNFSGAALFAGSPPAYQVLSGRWTLMSDGRLQLGEDSEPARAEVGASFLRLEGAEGSIVLERAELR
jgi:hypothetical protein